MQDQYDNPPIHLLTNIFLAQHKGGNPDQRKEARRRGGSGIRTYEPEVLVPPFPPGVSQGDKNTRECAKADFISCCHKHGATIARKVAWSNGDSRGWMGWEVGAQRSQVRPGPVTGGTQVTQLRTRFRRKNDCPTMSRLGRSSPKGPAGKSLVQTNTQCPEEGAAHKGSQPPVPWVPVCDRLSLGQHKGKSTAHLFLIRSRCYF